MSAKWRVFPVVAVMMMGCPALWAQDGSAIGMLPSLRRAIKISDSEANPFARKEEPKPPMPEVIDDSASEESRIASVLSGLVVCGRTKGANGWKVLLGDMILENGKILPPVIEGQTQVLRVAAIYDSLLEIEWVDESKQSAPRRIVIPFGMAPKVNSALSGAAASPGESEGKPIVVTAPAEAPRILQDGASHSR